MPKASALSVLGAICTLIPTLSSAQERTDVPPPPTSVVVVDRWSDPWSSGPASLASIQGTERNGAPAGLTVLLHTGAGAAAGLLIGLVLRGAAVGDDGGTVVLTWTAIGAAAGLISGVITAVAGTGR